MDVIVGGGVVGLSIAWRLARSGRAVTVVDPAPASGASHAAAGMLAPVSEVTYTEEPLLRLGIAALRRWPAFAADLTADAALPPGGTGARTSGPTATGAPPPSGGASLGGPPAGSGSTARAGGASGPAVSGPGKASSHEGAAVDPFGGLPLLGGVPAEGRDVLDLRSDGTLDVAFGGDDLAALGELAAFMEKLGLPVERLTGRECRRLEPMLAPSVRGGLLAPGDAWVDPRRVTAALLVALERRGVPLVRERAAGLSREGGRVTGVRLESGEEIFGERVVLAAGAWSAGLADVPVRPVKGQIMRLRSPEPLLGRCVRGMVHGTPVYLVPRGDGELVVGATQEELGFDTRVTAGGLYELLRDARELVPGVTELEVADVVAGLRPGTPDNLPIIGPGSAPGLVLATGHFRGGVLMAPLTAAILQGEEGDLASLCSPARFRDIS
ncbi:FAD-dependent oxidoreductase [Nonomuraea sp. ATR24]|uniref:FAD-dependent oxidoreductase n=1 Tax=Nonomuraea sp. ATR24 TaxID=1676744 RepID=UPI0035C0E418